MDFKEFKIKFNAWKKYELNVAGDSFSPMDIRCLDSDLFYEIARQRTPSPKNTIWNDDYFWENMKAADRFLRYLKAYDGEHEDGV